MATQGVTRTSNQQLVNDFIGYLKQFYGQKDKRTRFASSDRQQRRFLAKQIEPVDVDSVAAGLNTIQSAGPGILGPQFGAQAAVQGAPPTEADAAILGAQPTLEQQQPVI